MSRASELSRASALFVLACLTGGAAAAATEGCDPVTGTSPTPTGWQVTLEAPCHPYTALEIHYGALRVPETTGGTGRMEVALPVLPDIAAARIEGGELDIVLAVPPSLPPSGFFWLMPRGVQTSALDRTGFAAEGDGILPELRLFAPGKTPDHLDIPVTPEACGQVLTFELMRDGWDTLQNVRLNMPACGSATEAIRLPLPAR